MLKKRLFSILLAIAMLGFTFSLQIFAAEPIVGSNLQKLAMTSSDVQQCYNIGKEMLTSYYSAETCGTDINLDSYFLAPMLKAYTNEKVNIKRLIVEDYKDNITMLSTNFTLYDYNVSSNYIYCQINAQVEYRDDAIVGENKISGYGEPVKMLFIKTNDGYKIADWYTDSTLSYDQINRGLAVSMNDPDVWLKSSSASILSNCEEYQDCLEASL